MNDMTNPINRLLDFLEIGNLRQFHEGEKEIINRHFRVELNYQNVWVCDRLFAIVFKDHKTWLQWQKNQDMVKIDKQQYDYAFLGGSFLAIYYAEKNDTINTIFEILDEDENEEIEEAE